MLCLQECIDMCGLSEEAVHAIAEQEHLPEIVAAELGCTLLQSQRGHCLIRQYLQDTLEQAHQSGDDEKASALRRASEDFENSHPS